MIIIKNFKVVSGSGFGLIWGSVVLTNDVELFSVIVSTSFVLLHLVVAGVYWLS